MNRLADCQPLDSVYASFNVTMHSPAGRKRAAHVHLKDAAHALGANAVILTSNNWGVVTDQVNGVAYKCGFGKPGSLASGTDTVADDPMTDRYDRVREAKQLYDDGVLTKKEYEAEKRRILAVEDWWVYQLGTRLWSKAAAGPAIRPVAGNGPNRPFPGKLRYD